MNKMFLVILLCLSWSCSQADPTDPASPWLKKAYVEKRMDSLAKVAGKGPSQWRVIWTKDPATSATVSWTTANKGGKHLVRYGILAPGKKTENGPF